MSFAFVSVGHLMYDIVEHWQRQLMFSRFPFGSQRMIVSLLYSWFCRDENWFDVGMEYDNMSRNKMCNIAHCA